MTSQIRDEFDDRLSRLLGDVSLPSGSIERWKQAIAESDYEAPSERLKPQEVAASSHWRRGVLALAACLLVALSISWLLRSDSRPISVLADRAVSICTRLSNQQEVDYHPVSETNRHWLKGLMNQFRSMEPIEETLVRGKRLGEYWGVVRVQRSDGAIGWLVAHPGAVTQEVDSTFQLVRQRTGGWSVAVAQSKQVLVFFVAEGSNHDLEKWLIQRQTT